MAGLSAFTISTSTYTVTDTYSYDLYYVDTSISNTPITITLPTTVGNTGNSVRFKSVTSVLGGDTANNLVTIVTAVPASQAINFDGLSQIELPKGAMVTLVADEPSVMWSATVTPEFVPAMYGDGSDGTVTATSGSLASDMYYENLIVPNGVSLKTANFRVFVRSCLTLQGTGSLNNDGNPGGVGGVAVGGSGGSATTSQ